MTAPEVHEALAEVPEPTEDGWYAYDDSALTLIFRLTRGQWYAVADNGSMAPCVWGYIEQVLSTCNLVPLVPASVLADHFAEAATEARAAERLLLEYADSLPDWRDFSKREIRVWLRARADSLAPEAPSGAECTCPYTDPSMWLSAASCGYGSGYEPGSMQEWNPDCPVHRPAPSEVQR